ncbi:MAG TPA: hypothetical protein VK518_20610, partial [Puia sp.]|nr:hypothetical protein [Puia sp.]
QDERCFAFARKAGDDEVVVILNLSTEWLTVANSELLLRGAFQELFTGVGVDFSREKEVYISPWGYVVLEKRF